MAIALAQEGADVVLAARSQEGIEQTAATIKELACHVLPVPTDVSIDADIANLREQVLERFGKVDVLVNNAGVPGAVGPAWDVPIAKWKETLDVNLLGQIRCVNAFLPSMMHRRRGKIINVASQLGWTTVDLLAPYCVSKAALIHYTRCLAEEVKPYGINVHAIGVSAYTSMYEEQVRARAQQGGPSAEAILATPVELRRQPEENVGLVVFLASRLSDHITGQYIEANSLPASELMGDLKIQTFNGHMRRLLSHPRALAGTIGRRIAKGLFGH
jgi:NAD(P)-dependent dehydrogenase (short-subunit alcohol dehydrogenase family)